MDFAPEIDWGLALGIATMGQGSLPETNRTEVARFVADVRLQAREAGGLAARAMGMDSAGATEIRVVDRDGWIRAASDIAAAAIDVLGWTRRPAGVRRRLVGTVLGLGMGVGLAAGSRWLLGQYDWLTGRRVLYLVAPNLAVMERRNRFVARDFRRWVGAHEQTHALQFELAPWLPEHMAELMRGSQTRAAIDQIVATMTFLEGHADHISDRAPGIPTAQRMRQAFGRRPGKGGGLLDKGAQYANGLEFCNEARRLAGRDPFAAAFEKAEHLPTKREIREPREWLDRVHG